MHRLAARRVHHVLGVLSAAVASRASPTQACGPYHEVVVGIHLGLAFGGPGLPLKLNYGVTGRFGRDAAAFTRLEVFGLNALQLTAGITGLSNSVFLEGGMTGTFGFNRSAAGLHLGGGPASRIAGVLVGGSVSLIGDRSFKYLQSAAFAYPREVCINPG
jgi:hypothetical protein